MLGYVYVISIIFECHGQYNNSHVKWWGIHIKLDIYVIKSWILFCLCNYSLIIFFKQLFLKKKWRYISFKWDLDWALKAYILFPVYQRGCAIDPHESACGIIFWSYVNFMEMNVGATVTFS